MTAHGDLRGDDAVDEDDQVYVPLDTAMHRLINIDYSNAILFDSS